MEKHLESKVGKEVAGRIVADYIANEKELHASEKSKVMFYQRRKGMRLVMTALGVTEQMFDELHKRLFPAKK